LQTHNSHSGSCGGGWGGSRDDFLEQSVLGWEKQVLLLGHKTGFLQMTLLNIRNGAM
ncbi:hypothetical protein HispidOSU_022509, partial [Sigmodon hispidus]